MRPTRATGHVPRDGEPTCLAFSRGAWERGGCDFPGRRGEPRHPRRGALLIAVLICVIVITLLGGALLRGGLARREQLRAEERRMQALWLAESGLERAAARLAAANDYAGETWEPSADDLASPWGGRVTIAVERVEAYPERRRVIVRADYPRDATLRARQTKQAMIELSSEPSGEGQ
jgi:type II secretory pathway pseudopilin PulG